MSGGRIHRINPGGYTVEGDASDVAIAINRHVLKQAAQHIGAELGGMAVLEFYTALVTAMLADVTMAFGIEVSHRMAAAATAQLPGIAELNDDVDARRKGAH
jgi:hypothetical protein